MARINVEQKALTDIRFKLFGIALGASKQHAHAVGLHACVRLWNECIERGSYILSSCVVDAVVDSTDASANLVEAELAEWASDKTLRIKGTKGRTEYLGKLRDAKVRAGKARAAGATRDPATGTFVKGAGGSRPDVLANANSTKPGTSTSTTQQATSRPPAQPSAPAPAPAPALSEETPKPPVENSRTETSANGDQDPHTPVGGSDSHTSNDLNPGGDCPITPAQQRTLERMNRVRRGDLTQPAKRFNDLYYSRLLRALNQPGASPDAARTEVVNELLDPETGELFGKWRAEG